MERVVFQLLHLPLSDGEGWVLGWQTHPTALPGERLHHLILGWLHGSPCTIPGTTARHLCYVNTLRALMYSVWNRLQRCAASSLQKKVLLPPEGKHSLASLFPSFPFPPPHCWILAPLKCSCPCSLQAFNLTISACKRSNVSSSPLTSPAQGLAEQQGALEGVLIQDPCRTSRIAAGLSPTPSLGAEHGVWGSQDGSSASKTAQMLKLEQIRGTHLFSQQSNSHPFYHKSFKSWISLCPGNSSSGR